MQKQKLKNVYFYTSTVFCIILIFHILWSSLGNVFGAAIFNFLLQNIKTGLDICACVFLPLNAILYVTVYKNELPLIHKISMAVASVVTIIALLTKPLLLSERFNGDTIIAALIHEFCISPVLLAVIIILIISAVKYPVYYDGAQRYNEKKAYFFISAVFCLILTFYVGCFAVKDFLIIISDILNICVYVFLPLNAAIYATAYQKELSIKPKAFMFISSGLAYLVLLTKPLIYAGTTSTAVRVLLTALHLLCAAVFLLSFISLIIAMKKYPKYQKA